MRKILVLAAVALFVVLVAVAAVQFAPQAAAGTTDGDLVTPAPTEAAGSSVNCYVQLDCPNGGYRSCSGSSSCYANVGTQTIVCDGAHQASCPES